MRERPHLLFVSPRFLFPTDEGGKIRTTQILRGMKGGRFYITLISPAKVEHTTRFGDDLKSICDRFVSWDTPMSSHNRWYKATRMRYLFSEFPLSVASSAHPIARQRVEQQLAEQPDVTVFDFIHSAILAPSELNSPTVLFTHNVEAEIFRRHAQVAVNPLIRYIWQSQYRKMTAFEASQLPRFDTTVAVSQRDAEAFSRIQGIRRVATIPTGVDLEFFAYHTPGNDDHIVFTGAMDWQANIDGISFFMDQVWPLLAQRRVAQMRMTIVGRNPAPELVERARKRRLPWTFTGFVDDIRPHVYGAAVYVIPLRVGGGTRIKAYEAMAMGLPVVSTGLGIEGLPLTPDEHYLRADSPQEIALAIDRLLSDPRLRIRLSHSARQYVENQCSFQSVARCFEDICLDAVAQH